MSILIYAEYDETNKALKESSNRTLSAALKLQELLCQANPQANNIDMLLCTTTEPQLDALPINKLFYAQLPDFSAPLAQDVVPVILQIASSYDYILAPDSTSGKVIMPYIAMHFNSAQISDIIEIVDVDIFKRPIYTGNAIATMRSNDARKIITIRSTAFSKLQIAATAAAYIIEKLPAEEGKKSVRLLSQTENNQDEESLEKAKIIISGGRGLQSKEQFAEALKPLAKKLAAAIGASRAAVDAGFAPNDWQIGQTGKIVSPQLYIAIGISGALQHLAGIKNSQIIVAINKDDQAPIVKIADYALIGDLFDIIPQLIEEL